MAKTAAQRIADRIVPNGATKYTFDKANVVVYVYTSDKGHPCAVGFSGTRQRESFGYRFMDEKRRETYVREFVEREEARVTRRKSGGHNWQVGDIGYSSWGYDQTNITWYQVIAVTAQQIRVREINGERNEATRFSMQGKTTPIADDFVGGEERRKAEGDVANGYYGAIYKWDGTPKSYSRDS